MTTQDADVMQPRPVVASERRARKRKAREAPQSSVPPTVDTVPLDPVADAAHDLDAVTESVKPDARGTPGDLAEIDVQINAAYAQLAASRAEVVRLKRKREAAEARHAAEQERRALQRFAAAEIVSDEDFVLIAQAVQRDPRASRRPSKAREAFHEAIAAGQELALLFVELVAVDGVLKPTLIDGAAAHTQEERAAVQRLLGEVAECEGIITGGGSPQKE